MTVDFALVRSANGVDPVNLAVQLTRVVPASGNLGVCGQQFWPGPAHAGTTITLWPTRPSCTSSRTTCAARLQQLLTDRGRPADPPPLPGGASPSG
ncbi:hypothetical protein ABT369_15630 [Dactylosporangium sp. NPDC000244]|uniref:hypothetical protein n=1 Tax=Dactylosporangium sp. NPDC000244 TaxID=3154365 RepID=UPI003323083B